MDIGDGHGLRLRFDAGLLAGVVLDAHRKPTVPVRERLSAPGLQVHEIARPSRTADDVVTTTQELGVGVRKVLITAAPEARLGMLVTQRFELRVPTTWSLDVPAEPVRTEFGIAFEFANRITILVSASVPCGLQPGGVRVEMPAGTTELTMSVTSEPIFDVGDTVVVCRPDQMLEAAIVTSCLPADRLTPIVVLGPPPMTESEYLQRYAAYVRGQETSSGYVGTRTARVEVLEAGPDATARAMSAIDETRRLRLELSPYRSWVKRNEMNATLLTRIGFARKVFLFDAQPQDLQTMDPAFAEGWAKLVSDRWGDDLGDVGHLFWDVAETIRLTPERYVAIEDLTTVAWQQLNGSTSQPGDVIEIPVDDRTGFVGALFTALRCGVPLRAVPQPTTHWQNRFDAVNPNGPEAVLVEQAPSASALLGAVYAHHRAARLVVIPEPDLTDVQRVVDDYQRRITGAVEPVRWTDGSAEEARGLFDRLWRAVSGRSMSFTALEEAVTKQVPAQAIAAVGDRSLTAFTAGLPYSFVRTETSDWSRKPIGHVAADADLVILNELYSEGVERSAAAFTIVVDPGFFRVSETPDVLKAVDEHFTHPILLSGADATFQALIELPPNLPIELMFFNTHGTDDSIVLDEGEPFSSGLITQYFNLDSRPIVFNNSCQSWTGVGREFIRVGARGYIGSLWSIPSRPAADFARTVIRRITAGEATVAEAITNTGLEGSIERSYIYSGTANGRLDQWPDAGSFDGDAAIATATVLVEAAEGASGHVARLLGRELANLRTSVDHATSKPTTTYVDVLLDELQVVVGYDDFGDPDARTAGQLAATIDLALDGMDLPAGAGEQRRAARHNLSGRLWERFDEYGAALKEFQKALGYGDACPERASTLLTVARLVMRQGDWSSAQLLAQEAHDAASHARDQRTQLRAIGLQGQLSKRGQRLDEALKYAEEGYLMATELNDVREQCAFLIDACTVQTLDGDLDTALHTGMKALALARQNGDEGSELTVLGRVGTCHRLMDNLNEAKSYATAGLRLADALGAALEQGSFLYDLGSLSSLQGDETSAADYLRRAVEVLDRVEAWELCAGVLVEYSPLCEQLGDIVGLWTTAVVGSRALARVDEAIGSTLLPAVVSALRHALFVGPPEATELGLEALDCEVYSQPRDSAPPQVQFLGHLLVLVAGALAGDDQEALLAAAKDLDEMSGGEFELWELIGILHAIHHRI
jgi:tetratricopeptide (TPR) repeat protein